MTTFTAVYSKVLHRNINGVSCMVGICLYIYYFNVPVSSNGVGAWLVYNITESGIHIQS